MSLHFPFPSGIQASTSSDPCKLYKRWSLSPQSSLCHAVLIPESEAVNQFYLAQHCTNSLHKVTGIYNSKHRCVYFILRHALSFSKLSIRKLWSHCLRQAAEPSAESTSMARILVVKMRCERLCFAQKNVSILLEGATPNKIKTVLAALSGLM